MGDWQDALAGERMKVDQEFAPRVRESPLSNQQWGLVMTAVEFEFERATDPERARIVANTERLEHVLPEIRAMDEGRPGGPTGSGGGGSGSGGGIVDAVKRALGLGGGGDDLRAVAEELAADYAEEFQAHLERQGSFEEVRRRAADEDEGEDADREN
jgi:hypothetical protein